MSPVETWERVLRTSAVGALAFAAAVSCGAPLDHAPSDESVLSAEDFEADEFDDPSALPGNENPSTDVNEGSSSSGDGSSKNGHASDGTAPSEETPDGDAEEGEALGAPIDVPAEVRDQGRPLADMRAIIEDGIRAQCGGGLCVELVVEHSAEDRDQCTFIETRPPQRSSVARGSTVVIVAGSLPCPTQPPEDGATGGERSASDTNDGAVGQEEPEAEQEAGKAATAVDGP